MITITAVTLPEFRSSGISIPELENLLPVQSLQRLKRIINPESYLRSLLGEILVRYSIIRYSGIQNSDIQIHLTDKGKPFLSNQSDIHFNLSHSGNMVACAVADSEIGIDIEHKRNINFKVAQRFFSPNEIKDLFGLEESFRQDYFFTLWTIKESFLKAIGSGLTRNLNTFTVMSSNNGYMLVGDDVSASYQVKTYLIPGSFYIAVSCKRPSFPEHIEMVPISEILNVLAFVR